MMTHTQQWSAELTSQSPPVHVVQEVDGGQHRHSHHFAPLHRVQQTHRRHTHNITGKAS